MTPTFGPVYPLRMLDSLDNFMQKSRELMENTFLSIERPSFGSLIAASRDAATLRPATRTSVQTQPTVRAGRKNRFQTALHRTGQASTKSLHQNLARQAGNGP